MCSKIQIVIKLSGTQSTDEDNEQKPYLHTLALTNMITCIQI